MTTCEPSKIFNYLIKLDEFKSPGGTENECKQCPDTCATCTSLTDCTSCKNGYLNFAKDGCVSDCFTNDNKKIISYDNVSCVDDCGSYKLSADKTRCLGNCEEGINYQFLLIYFR